ncbi:MAG TPA: [NiFe]-hydrogenase assembly chaperone HybE [Rubrivivax sp.]|nr:[NiFe]-hydrogenase assembly chaperone HybE [Rubrivivax sp.]
MTDLAQPLAPRPCPNAALEALFRHIAQQRMAGVPILNPALSVEAVGFRPWDEHWLGVLITPWFMNLWLMPRNLARWQPIAAGTSRHYVFPAGVFEFIGGFESTIGDYQACSLFSPMFDFDDPATAHDTALAALEALFDAAHRDTGETAMADAACATQAPAAPAPAARPLSKRDFLFGPPRHTDRGP